MKISTANFMIDIDDEVGVGFFEHNEVGDECGGGLWFDGRTLTDYDGVYDLPSEVQRALLDNGYQLDI